MAKRIGERDTRGGAALRLKKAAGKLLVLRPVNAIARRAVARLSPSARARLPLALPSVSYRQTTDAVTLLEPRIDQVARDIYWGGGRPQSAADARVLRFVEAACRAGGTFLDVGSYSGLFALAAARASKDVRAIAYEIVPENFLLIWRNVIANDLAGQVEPRLLGIGDARSTITVPANVGLPALASSLSLGSKFHAGVAVPVTTLDEECVAMEAPLVIKIDVEGFEGAVFRGGGQTIARLCPDLVCELLADSEDHAAIEAMLAPLGYRFFQSLDEGLIERERIAPGREGRDWLFSARGDVDALLERL